MKNVQHDKIVNDYGLVVYSRMFMGGTDHALSNRLNQATTHAL
jgi:hypothetical protein